LPQNRPIEGFINKFSLGILGIVGMNDKVSGFPQSFGRIQDNGRVSLPKEWRDELNWIDGDQVCFHFNNGRITVENLEAKWRKEK